MNQKRKVSVKQKKRIALGFLLLCLLLVGLTFRIGWHQIVRADELTEKAREQQTQDVPIAAKRGTIYDRNGKELASSITCYSVWVRPAQLLKDSDGNALPEEKVTSIAEKLAKITGQEAEEVRELITRKQARVTVAKYLDKETADQVRALKLSGVQISEDNRRYYSLGNFASQVLGSVTDDNTGRTEIELEYDQNLSGVYGRWV